MENFMKFVRRNVTEMTIFGDGVTGTSGDINLDSDIVHQASQLVHADQRTRKTSAGRTTHQSKTATHLKMLRPPVMCASSP